MYTLITLDNAFFNFLLTSSERTRLVHGSRRRRETISSPIHSNGTRENIQKDTTSVASDRGLTLVCLVIVVSLIFGSFFSFVAVFVDRAYNTDPTDPRFRDRIRREWTLEQVYHERKVNYYRAEELSWERKIQRKIREYEERLTRERREREQMRLYWADVEPVGQCLGKHKREYKARLANLLFSIDGVAACKATPFVLNGKTYESPQYCEPNVRIPAFLGIPVSIHD